MTAPENGTKPTRRTASNLAVEPADPGLYPPVIEREGYDGRGHFHAVTLRPNGKEPALHIHAWGSGYTHACVGEDISNLAEASTPLEAIRLALEKYMETENNIS